MVAVGVGVIDGVVVGVGGPNVGEGVKVGDGVTVGDGVIVDDGVGVYVLVGIGVIVGSGVTVNDGVVGLGLLDALIPEAVCIIRSSGKSVSCP
jgi:hypothetical protein